MYTLYDYQRDALKQVLRAFAIQVAVLMIMATGLGKTVVAAIFAKREYKRKQRGLFLCHENNILNQAFDDFRQELGPKAVLRKFYGMKKDWNADNADVLFASFQSFKDWHKAFDRDHFDYIIVDESHHGPAPTYKRVIKYFKPKKLLGMSALKKRTDELSIEELFGKPVVDFPLEMGLALGWLTYVEYHVKNDGINASMLQKLAQDILEKGKRISIKQLNENIFIKTRDEEIAAEIRKYSKGKKKTIIFCENIKHAENFSKYLPGSVLFHSHRTDDQNRQALQDFRDGKVTEILAVDKFNEGIDVPNVEVIVFLRSTGSLNVFLQQLGRGLRKIKGKKKVIVLDFVANCERLMYLAEMGGKVNEYLGSGLDLSKEQLHVSGDAFDFIFTDQQIDILEILKRLKADFYPTWEEAGEAATKLGIKSLREYKKKYRLDHKLPSHPEDYYTDFPGYRIYLKQKYFTCEEAAIAARKLGFRSQAEYFNDYKKDSRLPSDPSAFYRDFPGWIKFLDTRYETWQEAGKAARELGIKNSEEYKKKYRLDLKLRSDPQRVYPDFPGWKKFLGIKKVKDIRYSTWEKAAKAAKDLGITTRKQYYEGYIEDVRLPKYPNKYYRNFPGFRIFIGSQRNSKKYYKTWQSAGRAAIKLGIRTLASYQSNYHKDPRLPADPSYFYKNFPGYGKFLKTGRASFKKREAEDCYATFAEASNAAKALGFRTKDEYKEGYRQDPKLPSNPNLLYPDFPGYADFLEFDKGYYKTWQEASESVQKLKITGSVNYKKKYRKDSKLVRFPEIYYKDFPGWRIFVSRYYLTWQEAKDAFLRLKIKKKPGVHTRTLYLKYRKKDPKLPGRPDLYYNDFSGWKIYQ